MRNYKALLLDLDGTLLDIDVSFFIGPMVETMYLFFSDAMDPGKFREALFGSTGALMENPRYDGQTNREGFYRFFAVSTGLDAVEAEKRFQEFYDQAFPTLKSYASPAPGGQEFVASALSKGYVLALATNPIFPVGATVERVRWAGLDPEIFRIIPGLENMSSCKPSVRYFLEICEIIGVDPSRCLMVGNDMEQDLPASDAGMDTYLVERNIISRGEWDRAPDASGTLEDLSERLGI